MAQKVIKFGSKQSQPIIQNYLASKAPQAPTPNISGKAIWGGAGQMGASSPTPQWLQNQTQVPIDPTAEANRIAAERGINVMLGQLPYQQGAIGQDYGYNSAGVRDYSNPYSRASLLEESYKRSKLGTTNSYAAQGQLYSGAYGRMQGENDRNLSIGSDQLQRAASGAYSGLDTQLLNNAFTYGSGLSDTKLAELKKALGVTY